MYSAYELMTKHQINRKLLASGSRFPEFGQQKNRHFSQIRNRVRISSIRMTLYSFRVAWRCGVGRWFDMQAILCTWQKHTIRQQSQLKFLCLCSLKKAEINQKLSLFHDMNLHSAINIQHSNKVFHMIRYEIAKRTAFQMSYGKLVEVYLINQFQVARNVQNIIAVGFMVHILHLFHVHKSVLFTLSEIFFTIGNKSCTDCGCS